MASWAKKKLITQSIVSKLIDIAKKKGNEEMEISLKLSYKCLNNVVVSGDKMYGYYCSNRICPTCMGIRKAKIINNYIPIIQSWGKSYMVTLTAKSCYAKSLNFRTRAMKRAFKKIYEKCKKRHQRGKGSKVMGIKSLECNFNATLRTYNFHYHLIVPSWEVAILLKREWLKLWTKKFTNGWAQDIVKIDNTKAALIEVVKYASKVFSEPDPNAKNKKKVSRYVYASALYNILSAMRGIRLFDRFGFNLPKDSANKAVNSITLLDYENLVYQSGLMDWVNEETGEMLTEYSPKPELLDLLNHRINTTLE